MQRFFVLGVLFSGISFYCLAQDTAKTLTQLKNKDPEIRRAAAKSLANTDGKDSAVINALVQGLKDSDVYVRKFSAQSLGAMKANAKDAVNPLAGMLNSASEKKENQQTAATALGKIGPDSFEVLLAAFKDTAKSKAVREKVLEALGDLGKASKSAVPEITDALKDTDLRFSAAVALGKIGPDASGANEALKTIAEDKKERDKAFREAVSSALKKIQAKK